MSYYCFKIQYPYSSQVLSHREMFLNEKYAIQNESAVVGWVATEELAVTICALLNSDAKSRGDVLAMLGSRLQHITDSEADNSRLKQKIINLSDDLKKANEIIDQTNEDVFITW